MFRFQPPARNLQGPARSLKTVVLCGFRGIRFRSAMLVSATKSRIQQDKILRFLVEGTVSETGAEFFRALARNLSEALQTYAWVTEYACKHRPPWRLDHKVSLG